MSKKVSIILEAACPCGKRVRLGHMSVDALDGRVCFATHTKCPECGGDIRVRTDYIPAPWDEP